MKVSFDTEVRFAHTHTHTQMKGHNFAAESVVWIARLWTFWCNKLNTLVQPVARLIYRRSGPHLKCLRTDQIPLKGIEYR
jgi:hypothetical protein